MKRKLSLLLALFGCSLVVKSQTNKLLPDGNVGIGTMVPGTHFNYNPSYLTYTANNRVLSVYDTLMPVIELIKNAGNIAGNKIGAIYFTNTLNQADGHKQVAGIWSEPAVSANYPTLSGGKLVFMTKTTNAAAVNSMTLDEKGNLTIGKPNAEGFRLAVDGTIGAKKVKVTQSSWADFVFAPDYELPSLKELELFILTHRHLPGIPSEKEVLANGLDLGAFSKQLLQKNEEQALYIIQMEKKLEALTERMIKVEAMLNKKEG